MFKKQANKKPAIICNFLQDANFEPLQLESMRLKYLFFHPHSEDKQ